MSMPCKYLALLVITTADSTAFADNVVAPQHNSIN